MPSATYYADDTVEITSTHAALEGRSHPLAEIVSAKLEERPVTARVIGWTMLSFLIGALLVLIGMLFGVFGGDRRLDSPAAYFAYFLMALSLVIPFVLAIMLRYV